MMHGAGVTVLVDPWLVGQLTFGGLSWVYAGNKKGPKLDCKAIAAGADFMLITQARNLLIDQKDTSQTPTPAVSTLVDQRTLSDEGSATMLTLPIPLHLPDARCLLLGTAKLAGPLWIGQEASGFMLAVKLQRYLLRPRSCLHPTRTDDASLPQGLPDHAHKPTLEQLPRDLHVVANDAAAKVLAELIIC